MHFISPSPGVFHHCCGFVYRLIDDNADYLLSVELLIKCYVYHDLHAGPIMLIYLSPPSIESDNAINKCKLVFFSMKW